MSSRKLNLKTTVQEVDVRTLVKIVSSSKGLTIAEVSKRCGKAPATMSGILGRKRINLGTLHDILDAMDESVIIELSNGNKYKLVVE